MSDKTEIPIDTAELVLARKNAGMRNSSVSIGSNGRLLPNGNKDAEYRVTIRKTGKSEDKVLSERAMKLKDCKGLKGCSFAICAEKVFGKLPKNLTTAKSKCCLKNVCSPSEQFRPTDELKDEVGI
jgi:hypothetical protein